MVIEQHADVEGRDLAGTCVGSLVSVVEAVQVAERVGPAPKDDVGMVDVRVVWHN